MSLISEIFVLTDNFSFTAQSVDYIRGSVFFNYNWRNTFVHLIQFIIRSFLHLHLFLVCSILFLTSMINLLDCECLLDISQLVENATGQKTD